MTPSIGLTPKPLLLGKNIPAGGTATSEGRRKTYLALKAPLSPDHMAKVYLGAKKAFPRVSKFFSWSGPNHTCKSLPIHTQLITKNK